jgi:hypothetical protein
MSHSQNTSASYTMRRIHLEAARSKEHTEGSEGDGYDFVAPFDAAGHLSVEGWHAERNRCFVHRLEHGRVEEKGLLVHKAGGEGGGTWAFDYPDLQGADDEDRGYHFGTRSFVVGEYVSLKEHDGVTRTYRVKTVGPA